MIHLSHVTVTAYGSDPENRSQVLHISDSPMFSGGGTQPPKKSPVKPPKPPKKRGK